MLALCHTIIMDKNQKEKQVYSASSPDELALVNAAKFFGIKFIGRDENNNMLIKKGRNIYKFKLLELIEFSSER